MNFDFVVATKLVAWMFSVQFLTNIGIALSIKRHSDVSTDYSPVMKGVLRWFIYGTPVLGAVTLAGVLYTNMSELTAAITASAFTLSIFLSFSHHLLFYKKEEMFQKYLKAIGLDKEIDGYSHWVNGAQLDYKGYIQHIRDTFNPHSFLSELGHDRKIRAELIHGVLINALIMFASNATANMNVFWSAFAITSTCAAALMLLYRICPDVYIGCNGPMGAPGRDGKCNCNNANKPIQPKEENAI